jgi:hypothetical protein
METMEVGSIPTEHFDAVQIQTIGAETALQVTIETQTPKERICMNINTKIKVTIRWVATVAVMLAISCIGVRCCLVTPSA